MAASFQERLTKELEDNLADHPIIDLGPIGYSERLSGIVASDRFASMDFGERQDFLWDIVRKKFGSEATTLSTLVAFTKDEYKDLAQQSEA
ncbi:MAG: hypothetical protein GIW95_12265 [Candidatus Eremiobacteraeota bacterium]|nr:hypothetical protein [Candidatus Eremiobacteraeota bacterium]